MAENHAPAASVGRLWQPLDQTKAPGTLLHDWRNWIFPRPGKSLLYQPGGSRQCAPGFEGAETGANTNPAGIRVLPENRLPLGVISRTFHSED